MNRIDKGRRRFLGQLAATPLATAGLLPFLKMREALAAGGDDEFQDYKALVCVFLHGGADTFNMLVPTDQDGWNSYRQLRGDLAVPRDELLPLDGTGHGLNPGLPALHQLFGEGKLAILGNVGNLVEPLSADQYQAWEEGDRSVQVPPILFSHADQQHFWKTSHVPSASGPGSTGWGGRMADLLAAANGNPHVPITMNLAGHSAWLDAATETQLSLNTWNGVEGFESFRDDDWPTWMGSRTATWEALLRRQADRGGPLHEQLVEHIQRARSRASVVQQVLASSWQCDDQGENCHDIFATPYDEQNPLAAQLRMVARMIHAREALGQKRQIFMVSLGGWDTHGSQTDLFPGLLKWLDDGLLGFQRLMEEMGLENQVTLFTGSEFGRTLGTNGDGTDHGWGSHAFILGGAVNGGQIHGKPPVLERGMALDLDDVLLPTTATAQYGATLARWLGIGDDDLDSVFPYLKNFSRRDLGFMA